MIESYINISKNKFWLVTFLILLLPVSKDTLLLLFGTRTTAEVVGYRIVHTKPSYGESYYKSKPDYSYKCAVFQFRTKNAIVKMNGAPYINYDPGEKRTVIYDAKDPSKCIMPNLPYLYGFRRCILPILLLIVWIAIYTSFRPPKSFIKIKFIGENKPVESDHLVK